MVQRYKNSLTYRGFHAGHKVTKAVSNGSKIQKLAHIQMALEKIMQSV